jgi:hypothetical protein
MAFGLARIRREPRVNVPQLNKVAISMLYMSEGDLHGHDQTYHNTHTASP